MRSSVDEISVPSVPALGPCPGHVTGFRRAVTTSRARSCACSTRARPRRALVPRARLLACSTCAGPRRALVPRARLLACAGELQGADLPAVADQLEAGGDCA